MSAKDSCSSRWIGYASHRSSPLASSLSTRPVSASCRVP